MPTTPTIRLDVGGKQFRVSRSLLEAYPQTMLARLISETWHENEKDVIFIDRNGDRFQQILDYLRDPGFYASRLDSVLSNELDYFGISHPHVEEIITLPNFSPGVRKRVIKAADLVFQKYGEAVLRRKSRDQSVLGSIQFDPKNGCTPREFELCALFKMLTPEQLSKFWVPEIGIRCTSVSFESCQEEVYFNLCAVPFKNSGEAY